ncbi:MAG TPA: hypothetical protein VFC90_00195 [Planctomycetota bacterium]|nr:hypothetical protein [Planctomycetota bacterium]
MKVDYDAGFDVCTVAARQALRDLDLVVIGGELHSSEARIDARSDLTDVVRITLASPEDGKTRVTFHSGRSWDPNAKDLVGQLKDAFERHLNQPAGNQP